MLAADPPLPGGDDPIGHVRVHGAPHRLQTHRQPPGLCRLRRGEPVDRRHPEEAVQRLAKALSEEELASEDLKVARTARLWPSLRPGALRRGREGPP